MLLWGCKAGQLERLQKKVVRIITCSNYNAHSEPLLKKLFLLKATHICALHELKFCFKLEHNLLPFYFNNSMFKKFTSIHRHNTRRANSYQLPKFKHSFMNNSIRYRIPDIFNKTTTNITDKIHTHSLLGYKKYIKRCYITSYKDSCNIRNCYICQ